MNRIILALVLLLAYIETSAEHFNTNKLIVLSGSEQGLSEDEGFLLLNLKSNSDLDSITIKPIKKGNKIRFTSIQEGENLALIKLKSGDYYLNEIDFKNKGVNFEKNFNKYEQAFEVKAGVINYPGSWISKITLFQTKLANINFRSENRFTTDLKAIQHHFPQYIKDYKTVYQGDYEDPYSNYYFELKQNLTANKTAEKVHQSTFDIKDGITNELSAFKNINYYLDDDKQSYGQLNPSGSFIVFRSLIKGVTKIEIINTTTFKSVSVFKEELPKTSRIKTIKWIDNNSIYFQAINKTHPFNQVVHLTIKDEIITGAKHINIPLNGDLIDPLIKQQNRILFSNPFNTKVARKGLFNVDISNEKSIKKSLKKNFTKKAVFDEAFYWLTDSEGELRLILTSEYNETNDDYDIDYWFLTEVGKKKWQKIKSFSSYDDIEIPVSLSQDESFFYVLTDNFGDKSSLHKYSTKDFSYIDLFYEDESIDIQGVLTDYNNQAIIGVSYSQDGFIKYKYFEDKSEILKPIQVKNPNLQLYKISQNANSEVNLVYGINEYTKGSWYIYKPKNEELLKFFISDKEYDLQEKGDFHHIKIKSKDDIILEGYLVLPKNNNLKKIPLIVNPHGGPIGTRDFAYTNEIQHFYASQGFATLKVNYRGSSGYGKKFKEMGHLQWGEKIESDINEMVDYVIDTFNVSKSKICTMGSSYGGYSAIMLTILYPQRYQCAVSFAGVTDIPLMFSSSDFKESDYLLEKFTEIAGNPEDNLDDLINKSPVYLKDKITKPILLFHGINDKRVTIEHSYRLNEVLKMSETPSELIILNNEAHGLIHKQSRVAFVARSLQFIQEQLAKVKE